VNSIKSYLDELTQILTSKQMPVLQLLRPGIQKTEMSKYTHSLPVELPEEIYELYLWREGTRIEENTTTIGEACLFPGGMFCSIERSVEAYKYFSGKDGYWKEDMFMLFESGGGEMYLIDCNKNSSTFGMIFEHSIGAIDYDVIIPIYDSLESLLKTIITCYQKDIYFYDQAFRMLRAEPSGYITEGKSLNPKSDFWNLFK
jgi:hypothetical protein